MAGLVPLASCEEGFTPDLSPWLVDGRVHLHITFSLKVAPNLPSLLAHIVLDGPQHDGLILT